jgi:two-component system sensor histidine kinase/response regulator
MTNDLLDVSRMEEGRLPLERSANDLVAIAGEARAALSALDRSRVIELDAAGPVLVRCDRAILKRVLENLLGNAIRHTPAGGRIAISVRAHDRGARVVVQDEGPGVPREARSKIFEKFGTVAARQERAFHSVGLGLAFSKLAVEAHGGVIGVDDAQPNGSLFWFELPS